MLTDAMGKEIIIGAFYGYSRRTNGCVSIVIGEAIKINEEKGNVTLEVIKKGMTGYSNPVESEIGPFKKSSVTANSIFKLEDTTTTW